MMMKSMGFLATLPVIASVVFAQERFEVASVKAAAPLTRADLTDVPIGAMVGGPGSSSPGRVSWRSTALGPLIRFAYGLKPPQLSAPRWVTDFDDDVRFDISATLPPGSTREQMNAMLRHLLEERFALRFHREMRQLDVYILRVAGSPKLSPSTAGPDIAPSLTYGSAPGGAVRIDGRRTNTAALANMLEFLLREDQAIVSDQTSLSIEFDLNMEFAAPGLQAADTGLPTLQRALERELGLKLEKGKAPVEILVVDAIQKVPTAN